MEEPPKSRNVEGEIKSPAKLPVSKRASIRILGFSWLFRFLSCGIEILHLTRLLCKEVWIALRYGGLSTEKATRCWIPLLEEEEVDAPGVGTYLGGAGITKPAGTFGRSVSPSKPFLSRVL